jgi:hypothetical protein
MELCNLPSIHFSESLIAQLRDTASEGQWGLGKRYQAQTYHD